MRQQRYKFIHQDQSSWTSEDQAAHGNGALDSTLLQLHQATGLSPALTGEFGSLASAFIKSVDPSLDIRFQLLFTFGTFLAHVPRRLGTNEALDAAAGALVTAYAWYRNDGVRPSRSVLESCSAALRALRQCLSDQAKARSAETLCAIFLIMIVQSLTGNGNDLGLASHSRGISRITYARGYCGPISDFEKQLLQSIRASTVFEALYDDQIRFSQQQWRDLIVNDLDSGTSSGRLLLCMARLVNLIQRRRAATRVGILASDELLRIPCEVRLLQQEFAPTLRDLRQFYEEHDNVAVLQLPPGLDPRRVLHWVSSRMYGLGLAVALLIDLVCNNKEGCSMGGTETTRTYVGEILRLSEEVAIYKPLGAMSMVVCLYIAWMGASKGQEAERVLNTLRSYQKDSVPAAALVDEGTLRELKSHLLGTDNHNWLYVCAEDIDEWGGFLTKDRVRRYEVNISKHFTSSTPRHDMVMVTYL